MTTQPQDPPQEPQTQPEPALARLMDGTLIRSHDLWPEN